MFLNVLAQNDGHWNHRLVFYAKNKYEHILSASWIRHYALYPLIDSNRASHAHFVTLLHLQIEHKNMLSTLSTSFLMSSLSQLVRNVSSALCRHLFTQALSAKINFVMGYSCIIQVDLSIDTKWYRSFLSKRVYLVIISNWPLFF